MIGATTRPQVSVVMSVYNGEAFLHEGLRSVLEQQGVDFEFIVVDDGSTDRSAAILREYAATDSRLRIIHQENAGLTRALVRGCAAARADFIARQDCDDLSVAGRLRAQFDLIDSDPSLSFVSCWAEVIGPAGETLLVHERPAAKSDATRMLLTRLGGPPGHGSVMFRKASYEKVGGYRPELYFAQDSDLWLRLAGVGQLAYVPSVLYKYRIAPESISGRLHPLKIAFAEIIDEMHAARLAGRDETVLLHKAAHLRRAPTPGNAREEKRATSAAQTNYFIARCLLKRRDSRAMTYLGRALREDPANLKAWAFLPWATLLSAMKA